MAAAGVSLDFVLPAELEAGEPPEARGLRRDRVRLLVSDAAAGTVRHARFQDLPQWLSPGDLLVVNTSRTLSAALPASGHGGQRFELHLSTRLPGGFWVVEVRRPAGNSSLPCHLPFAGRTLDLPDGAAATLLAPYPFGGTMTTPARLWIAALSLKGDLPEYLERFGFPIRYKYVSGPWPISMYQTVFATEPGSAEMPSAGRPFTPELVTTLVSRGVSIAPLLLHTGVSSLEDREPPYEEFFRVPRETADVVNAARRTGRRIVAVGTTVVRALETVTDERGHTSPGEGWTSVVVSRSRPVRAVDALITGLHEPRASHLMMLEQVVAAAPRCRSASVASARNEDSGLLERSYVEALEQRYLWHEFGDSHLILG